MGTIAVSDEQAKLIIKAILNGWQGKRPNSVVANCLIIQANTGLRIGDLLKLKLSDIVKENGRYRFNIIEEKTNKTRTFTVTDDVYNKLLDYCYNNNISKGDIIFKTSIRTVQRTIQQACDYLNIDDKISTHSFRKFFATSIYADNNNDVALVKELLQHADLKTTQRYIKVSSQQVEKALQNHSFNI